MYTSTQQERPAGISSGSIDALRVKLMKMNSQQLQAFATANQDSAIKLGLVAEADKYKKQHVQEAAALMSGQQQKPPIAQQILQNIGQPPQQPQQPQQPQPQPQQPQQPPQGQGMPPEQMAQGQMPPQGMADGGYMLPEDQGIATLPVGGMDFAGGGIVAFGGGGDVPGYAGGIFVNEIEAANRESLRNTGFPLTAEQRARLEQTLASNRAQQAAGRAAGAAGRPFDPSAYKPQTSSAPASGVNPYDPSKIIRRSDFTNEPYPEQNAPPPAPPKPAGEPGLPAIAATKFERTALPKVDVADTLALYKASMPQEIVDPMAAQRKDLNDATTQAAARQLSLFEQEVQKRKPAFEDRLKKLDLKEKRVDKMGEHNFNMSLLEAGLAMMSGDSPNAFVNIGKGAQVGVKAYAEGQAKVEAAKDKMEEARARIEEFRRSEDTITSKERRTLKNEYENTFISAKKNLFEGIQQQYGLTRQDVTSAIASQRAREEAKAQLSSRENLGIAGIQSNESIARAHMQNTRDVAKINAETYKLPMLYKQVEDSVDKQLATDMNYKLADEATKSALRDAALKKRLLATPGLAQYAGAATGGGGGGLRYNPQTGKIE